MDDVRLLYKKKYKNKRKEAEKTIKTWQGAKPLAGGEGLRLQTKSFESGVLGLATKQPISAPTYFSLAAIFLSSFAPER